MTVDESLFVFGQNVSPDSLAEDARRRSRGLYHGSRIDPRDPDLDSPVTLTIDAGVSLAADRVWLCYTTDGSDPADTSVQVPAEHVDLMWDDLAWAYVDRWTATIPGQARGARVRYTVQAESRDGGAPIFADSEDGAPVIFGYDVDCERVPDWIRDAVIYQIFVDRFWEPSGRFGRPMERADEIYGGTLGGVTDRLDYLTDLGVNVLWLTPIFPAETYHGYDALDFDRVADRVGGDEALERLVRESHERGIRILLDLAANHCSWHHPHFLDAQRDKNSRYRDWFTFRHWPDTYLTFATTPKLPKLNTRNPEVVAYLCDVAGHYLREVGVDGFRLDHAHGPPLLFWTQFREQTRCIRPDSYTVGEVTLSPGTLQWYEGRMDGCLDFPLLAAFRQFFIAGTVDAATFHSILEAADRFYGPDFSRPTFLDNHDMNRFLWLSGNDSRVLRLAATCQFALLQPPIVYYGTEIGMSQERDVSQIGFEAARLPMDWQHQQPDVLEFYRRLIHIRREHPAMRTGTRRSLSTRGRFYAFLCETDGERIAVAINAGDSDGAIELPGAGGVELLSGETVTGHLIVGPMQPAIVLLTDRRR